MHHLGEHTPATFIVHGTADTAVGIRSASLFVERLQQYGTKAELKRYEGRGHGFFNKGRGEAGDAEQTTAEMTQFLVDLGWLTDADS